MEITAIKENLSLVTILDHYNLTPNKNNMLLCPFHDDKTASLQVNLEKDFFKCHACGKKGDVIQFVQDYEKLSKREAILKCTELTGGSILKIKSPERIKTEIKIKSPEQIIFLEKIFSSFRKGVFSSKPAQEYLESRNVDIKKTEVGFNGGQFHHGARKEETLINQCLEYGLLIDKNQTARTGEKAYNVFGNKSIVFPLKNKENQIVSLYFRSIINEKEAKHFYLKNRSGLYPNYPNGATKKLILSEAIIDTASLLQLAEIINNYSLLACYGTNGLNEEIQNAIKELKELQEIIFAFDNDTAGKEAVKKYAAQFKAAYPNLKISTIELPSKDINETLQLHEPEIITELLAQRKEIDFSTSNENFSIEDITTKELPKEEVKPKALNAIEFLKKKNLLKRLNTEIGRAGIVGEENSRLLLFLIIISYMNKSPIHGIVQGSSGSGKTHIIGSIADLMPGEDVLRFTRITESSLYNWGEFDLFRKVIIIEDLDGLKEEALYALRELISNQFLSSSVSIKDKKGNNKSARKEVKGQFSSLSATTKGETYEDNMSRSFLIAVDESKEQTQRIITHQNKRNAGEIDPKEKQTAQYFIQQIVRSLKHYEVINPFATKLELPEKVHKIRRLNEMYQAVIKQVTFLNQYQRKQTEEGKIITEIEDIEQATEILFESIVLKVDELDGSLRQFFEKIKKFLKDKNQEFTQREIRQEFNISKSQCSRFFIQLAELEYITLKYGGNLKLQKYVIDYWDNHQKLRTEIKGFLMNQIEELRPKSK